MSADILAAPDLSLNARCNREVQQNRREEEENEVEIFEDEEHLADVRSQKARAHTPKKPAAAKRRCFTATAVAVGGMYLLMSAGIFLRYILVTLKKDQLEASFNKLSNDHIQLQGNYSGMAVNNSQLQSSYQTLSKNYSQLQEEVKRLKGIIKGRRCPDGWKRFGCSCYYKSSLKMSWQRSREECQRFGADLVVINTKEEQNFVSELNVEGESWIGLRRHRKTSGWDWVWVWVDGSPLTETFWASELLHESEYASCCTPQGRWTQSRHEKNFICEW
ncbi:C-type lectin domain family 6 member A-like [Chelmon rostratus]|uniref:C-type lectin domain family 6 member A-like n=1 Tax=Chelmon rostratus TaxID=109905 RepID=UPI001BE55076|nr:C-type lectin domain family 6 member A-like [Chelmon rostratus]